MSIVAQIRYHHLVASAPNLAILTTGSESTSANGTAGLCKEANLRYGDATSIYCYVPESETKAVVSVSLVGFEQKTLLRMALKPKELAHGSYELAVIGDVSSGLKLALIPLSGAKPGQKVNATLPGLQS